MFDYQAFLHNNFASDGRLRAMPDDFVVARNPDPDSALPYLIRVPLGPQGVVLKAREPWPRTSKVFCHRGAQWPADAEIVERWPVRACSRRGPAIDLVLDRGKENRSQLVFTRLKDGREAIFWQSPRTTRKARPGVRLPTRRVAGMVELPIVVDNRERYPYRFAHQKAVLSRGRLPAGDYGVALDGEVVAVVERKTLDDLAHSLVDGRLGYVLAELSSLPRAAVVVEDRYADVFKLEHVRGGYVAELLGRAQVRWPSVPIVFTETRPLAEEWTFRFLGAALAELAADRDTFGLEDELTAAGPVAPREPTTAEMRAWAVDAGFEVSDRGRLRPEVVAAFHAARVSAPPG
jgi:ERCC4 domain